mmetsp:Transcript_19981/g.41778  ORF Transcript_19981/g.41778 Transcript_19981/m.41778 type:complete len:294 (+) Transcript_19981:1559-2440(+)
MLVLPVARLDYTCRLVLSLFEDSRQKCSLPLSFLRFLFELRRLGLLFVYLPHHLLVGLPFLKPSELPLNFRRALVPPFFLLLTKPFDELAKNILDENGSILTVSLVPALVCDSTTKITPVDPLSHGDAALPCFPPQLITDHPLDPFGVHRPVVIKLLPDESRPTHDEPFFVFGRPHCSGLGKVGSPVVLDHYCTSSLQPLVGYQGACCPLILVRAPLALDHLCALNLDLEELLEFVLLLANTSNLGTPQEHHGPTVLNLFGCQSPLSQPLGQLIVIFFPSKVATPSVLNLGSG